jgi:hypothetical protein
MALHSKLTFVESYLKVGLYLEVYSTYISTVETEACLIAEGPSWLIPVAYN